MIMSASQFLLQFGDEADFDLLLVPGTPWPFTTTCTATNCFKALAHCCTQQLQHLRNPIHFLHTLVFSVGISHQQFQVFTWPWSPRIAPTDDGWPPTMLDTLDQRDLRCSQRKNKRERFSLYWLGETLREYNWGITTNYSSYIYNSTWGNHKASMWCTAKYQSAILNTCVHSTALQYAVVHVLTMH